MRNQSQAVSCQYPNQITIHKDAKSTSREKTFVEFRHFLIPPIFGHENAKTPIE
jgi:hypothetical protein